MKKTKTNRRSNHPFLGGLCLGASLLLAVGFYGGPNAKSANAVPANPDPSQPASVASTSASSHAKLVSQNRSPQTAGFRQFAATSLGNSTTRPVSASQQAGPDQSAPPPSVPPGAPPGAGSFITPGSSGTATFEALNPPQFKANAAAPNGSPSQNSDSENPPNLTGAPIGAPARGPNSSPVAPLDLGWRLLAQLAVHDTNATSALLENAGQGTVPSDAWLAIASTLVTESLHDGVLVPMDPSTLAGPAVQEGQQHLDLIESLIKVAPESAAQTLRDKVAWLSQQLSK